MDLKEIVTRKNNYVYGPSTNIKIEKDGLGCFLYDKFKEHGDKIFQVHALTGETETYSSVLKRSIRVALEMKRRGITENDNIVLCSDNSMDCFIPIFATQMLNATIASLDPSQSLRDVIYLLNLIEPKIIFVEKESSKLIHEASKEFNFDTEVVIIGNHKNCTNFSDFLKESPEEISFKPKPLNNHNNQTFIFFSSGTTGMPKGICLSGYGILKASFTVQELGFFEEIVIHLTSFYWISAIMATLPTITKGNKKVILPNYDVNLFLKAIQDHKITFGVLGSHVAYEINDEICSKYDLSSMKLIGIGGSTISGDQINKCRKLFPNATVLLAYGLTEVAGIASVFPKKCAKLSIKHASSCGVPIPGVIMKIVNPETEEVLGENKRGEIRIASNVHLLRYHKKDSSNIFDHEGFIKTGDIGYFDEYNFLYFCDRIKDMFKYKSWHIVPASVETVIYRHPAVKEAVVVGIPHPSDGDHPMAVIVLKENCHNVNEEEVKDFVNRNVLDREKLRGGLKIVKEFPKTPSGKIPRTIIRNKAIQSAL